MFLRTALALGCCDVFLAASALVAFGHDGDHRPALVQPADAYRPSALPDRIILTWPGDPATTQAVTWRTSVEVAKGLAEIAVADGGPGFPKGAKQVAATSGALLTDLNTAHFHSVKFVEL